MTALKRRARRTGHDEAHAWARNLRLGNPHAKLVLSMLTQYVDGDGCCWVSIPALAEDCELAQDTIRRRLAWLEEIGAIVRAPQWVDEHGRRNGDGRGKRTSDDIRLLIDGDSELIEARAQGETVPAQDGDGGAISPRCQQGLNPAADPVRTPSGLCQPSQSCDPLISEPEPESPLKAPQGAGESEALSGEPVAEPEPEHFAPAWEGWPGHQVMRRDLALAEFRALPPDKQRLCRAAVPLFAAMQAKLGRTRVMNFHLWVRSRGFDEFPNARLMEPVAEPSRRFVCGDELAGLRIVSRMVDRPIARLVDDPEHGPGFWSTAPLRPDLAALVAHAADDPARWPIAEERTASFAAWRERILKWIGGEVQAQRVWREAMIAGVHDVPPAHPDFRLRQEKRGFRVPAEWPPLRDGTWSATQDEGA